MTASIPERYVLITNLTWVTVHAGGVGVRTYTHALVLCDAPSHVADAFVRGTP